PWARPKLDSRELIDSGRGPRRSRAAACEDIVGERLRGSVPRDADDALRGLLHDIAQTRSCDERSRTDASSRKSDWITVMRSRRTAMFGAVFRGWLGPKPSAPRDPACPAMWLSTKRATPRHQPPRGSPQDGAVGTAERVPQLRAERGHRDRT